MNWLYLGLFAVFSWQAYKYITKHWSAIRRDIPNNYFDKYNDLFDIDQGPKCQDQTQNER